MYEINVQAFRLLKIRAAIPITIQSSNHFRFLTKHTGLPKKIIFLIDDNTARTIATRDEEEPQTERDSMEVPRITHTAPRTPSQEELDQIQKDEIQLKEFATGSAASVDDSPASVVQPPNDGQLAEMSPVTDGDP